MTVLAPSYFGDAGRGCSEFPWNSSVQSACFRPERGSLSGLAKLHSIYCWWVQLLAYVDLASCGECTMAQCKHITKSLAITQLDLNISRNRRPKSSRNVWFRCRNLEHLLTWKDSHSAKHTTWTLTKESTVSVSQQSGVLDQQLRKLLSSPGLPAVSPIALPLLSAHGEGRGAICCFPDLHTTIPYRTLRSIAEATRVGFFSAVALHKNVRNFLRAGRKGCTKMKSQSMNLMGIEFAWLYPGCGKFLQVWNKNFSQTVHSEFEPTLWWMHFEHFDPCIRLVFKKQMPAVVIVVLQVGLVHLHLKGPWTPYSLQELSFPKCW